MSGPETPIVDQELLLQRFPGKGGWTYAEVRSIDSVQRSNFGWVKVKGTIDGHLLMDYSLAPMKDGKLFLPVKAEIRKKIQKQAGDYVKVVLFKDDSDFVVPQEIIDCLKLEELAFEKFNKLSKSDQRQHVKWIYSAKKDETKADRISKMISNLLSPQKKEIY